MYNNNNNNNNYKNNESFVILVCDQWKEDGILENFESFDYPDSKNIKIKLIKKKTNLLRNSEINNDSGKLIAINLNGFLSQIAREKYINLNEYKKDILKIITDLLIDSENNKNGVIDFSEEPLKRKNNILEEEIKKCNSIIKAVLLILCKKIEFQEGLLFLYPIIAFHFNQINSTQTRNIFNLKEAEFNAERKAIILENSEFYKNLYNNIV
jgi:hypothetical protein